MASNASRLMLFRSPASPRWLSTATVTATATATATATTVPKVKADPLYRKLLALGGTDANVAETLDEWVEEGKSVKRFDIISSVKQLRKFKKYDHAIQVYILYGLTFCLVDEKTEEKERKFRNFLYMIIGFSEK